MKTLAIWVVIAAMLSYCVLGSTAYLDIPVVEDTQLQDGDRADTNYGGSTQLEVGVHSGYAVRSLVKFDLDGLEDIQFADLLLYQVGGPGTTPIQVFEVSDDSWTEMEVTWNTAPSHGTTAQSTEDIPVGGGYVSFDVTQSVLNSQDSTVSFLVKTSDEELISSNYKLFFSRETTVSPVLRLYYEVHAPQVDEVFFPATINEGDLVGLSFTAVDEDDDIEVYAIFLDGVQISSTNTALWQTHYMDAGQHELVFYVKDSADLADEYVVDVNVNDMDTVVINEFESYAAPTEEWIELYNPLGTDFNTEGCTLQVGSTGYALSGIIGAQSYGLVGGLTIMGNTGDYIGLTCGGILFDKVSYGDFDDGDLSDNAPAPSVGESCGRTQDGLDTDVDADDFGISTSPTPNAANEPDVVYHDADTDQNGCVSMAELLSYIGQWKADPLGIPLQNLLEAIALWKSNPIC